MFKITEFEAKNGTIANSSVATILNRIPQIRGTGGQKGAQRIV